MCDRSSDPTQYDGAAPDDASSRASSRSGAALTPRQREALAAYAETGDYLAASRRLGVAAQTYKNIMRRAYYQLNVTGAIDAFRVLGWLSARERPSTPDTTEATLRTAAREFLDAVEEGRPYTNKALRLRAALQQPEGGPE